MIPDNVTKIPLHQIASQQQDSITFDVSSIQSLANTPEAFLIFYLSKEDEFNGYGTVIQLDPQTKQATIYADLNPEYTYLFYKNEQQQLQTLLWCIEIATRTTDGLFIAHAKSYGRGISEEDVKRFQNVNLEQNEPETKRQLAEEYQPTPAVTPSPTPTPPQPATPTATAPQQSQPAPATAPSQQAVPPAPPQSAPAPPAPQPTVTANQSPSVGAKPSTPLSFTQDQAEDNQAGMELKLPPLPPKPQTQPQPVSQPTQNPGVTGKAEAKPTLPPPPPAQPTQPPAPVQPSPTPKPDPILQDIPDIFGPMPSLTPAEPTAPTPKQPVGRPPKPLMADQLWPVSPQDFNWAKNVSRQPVADFKQELWQKVMLQVRTNKPGLIEDWGFQGAFEQAFNALCTTYDLIPSLRHDIIKSLLNGRVVENVFRQQQK